LAAAPLAVGLAGQPILVTPLPTRLNLNGSTVVGGHLITLGGDATEGFSPKSYVAPINLDRTLGAWREDRPLPYNLIYLGNSVLTVSGSLYVCGGQQVKDIPGGSTYDKQPHRYVLHAPVGSDGSIAEWKRSTEWSEVGSVGAAAVTDQRNLYMLGGNAATEEGSGVTNAVCYAPILSDGKLGSWVAGRSMPKGLIFHSAYFHNGSIYVVGGRIALSEDAVSDGVYSVVVNDDGSLGEWQTSAQKLAYPVNGASACAADDFLFLFCGRTLKGELVERIQYSKLTLTGISEWRAVDTTITSRYYSSAAIDLTRRAVYIVGGRRSTNFQDTNSDVFCYPLVAKAAAPAAIPGGSAGFLPFEAARAKAQAEGKNLFVFAYSSQIDMSREALARFEGSAEFKTPHERTIYSSLDISNSPKAVRDLGIMRVPSYVVFDAAGRILAKESGIKAPSVIRKLIE
jgi:N-acetylneuraminic acid mutarotase